MLRLWYLAHRPLGQVAVGDHQVNIRWQIIDRAVGDRDVTQAGILHFLAQYPGAHGAGTHPGVAGDDDFTHMAQVVGDITGRQRAGAFGFRFHVMHTTRCGFDIVFFFYLAGLEQNRRDHEGDRHRCDNRGDVSEVGAFRRHRQHRQDRAWGSRRDQTAIEDGQGEDTGHPAEDNGQDQARVHQHVREVDFMDTTQEVDDSRPACRLFCAAAAKEHVRQQNAHPWTRVSFNQEEDGFTQLVGLLNTQRREDTVVDGVVKEQDFCRFDEDRRQRQHVVRHHKVNASRQNFRQNFDRRANAEEGQNGEDHPDDAGGEVIHQHFKTGFDLTVYPVIELLDAVAAQRAGNHGAEEHRHIRADDNAHGGDRPDHAATFAAD